MTVIAVIVLIVLIAMAVMLAILYAIDALNNDTDPVRSCPPCDGNCRQGRDCPYQRTL